MKTLRLLQITDTHCFSDDHTSLFWSALPVKPNQSLQRLLAHFQRHAADALIISGDLAQEESLATYQRLNQHLALAPAPVYVLPGNHDVPELMAQVFQAPTSHAHFQTSANFGFWHCYFLDTSLAGHGAGYLSQQKLDALRLWFEQLAPEDFVLLFMHHHPITIGSGWMESHGLQQAEQFWDCVAPFPQLKAIGFGHIHNSHQGSYQLPDGRIIPVLGTPATCVQLAHTQATIQFEHTRSGWREWLLAADGTLSSNVHFLPSVN
ncbi:metallophosphoesterase [Thiolinea disciformis]|uniref:metallophosphoesterase n=1 Tax=Thiolinea disciformis TaxID=125614 RepID=UPI00036428C0|nr:metallophosphoesterase [Thiolinea disciformis]